MVFRRLSTQPCNLGHIAFAHNAYAGCPVAYKLSRIVHSQIALAHDHGCVESDRDFVRTQTRISHTSKVLEEAETLYSL